MLGTATLHDLINLIGIRNFGPTLGRGWGIYWVQCDECNQIYRCMAIVGSKGYRCINCGAEDRELVWRGTDDQAPCDGAWLEPVGWKEADLIGVG